MATPQLYKATGIILKRNNSGEGDKIVTVFCEHFGKKRLIGKGIRKINSRRAGHLELFSKTKILIHRGKTLDYITGATACHLYGSSYQRLSQVASAYTACEVVDRLIMEGQEHDESFCLLDRFLLDIETAQSSVLPQRITAFIDDLLIILGYRRKETKSTSLGNATTAVERIIERKIKSVNLLFRTGMFQ
ncbi:MAG: repair protein RecO protein [Candidatus Gottesmanbacteria bacterium GW2011_GWA2_44_17]|uniref:Repair protein RecO protein n=3 Tax=Candidatus Gottesmaniibacteriota TaxID=1752720 RepID=A0A0G1LL48_9BACT|nr:MAG: repair protein RecO protein [Microgenomates group bacterium GW2011_GWC1_43_11]KKT38744.1 MAG: repair protein RecO protein [Candidatus Gottesmanbacteria bacterium GW2011_GWB1_44_11c]KKT47122.1 MAG: repair protein RecO protein [Candidatus Gottesmanbacteria bacterium GW2011_GWA2_44_17]KKT60614.1 MAG: repair protein RecO protein [Candidatus Gottesmanbacteria bacterium GW2011_GWA1_44_24b]HCM82876.1 DNA repair protein RecO [Patescibacteria group bacterium]